MQNNHLDSILTVMGLLLILKSAPVQDYHLDSILTAMGLLLNLKSAPVQDYHVDFSSDLHKRSLSNFAPPAIGPENLSYMVKVVFFPDVHLSHEKYLA